MMTDQQRGCMADGCNQWSTVTVITNIGGIHIRTYLCAQHHEQASDPRVMYDPIEDERIVRPQ